MSPNRRTRLARVTSLFAALGLAAASTLLPVASAQAQTVPCPLGSMEGWVETGSQIVEPGGPPMALCEPAALHQSADDIARSFDPGRDLEGERLQTTIGNLAAELRAQAAAMGLHADAPTSSGDARTPVPTAPPSSRWEFYGDIRRNAAPGQYCAVSYLAPQGGIVSLFGPGGSRNAALLTFMNSRIPAPPQMRTLRVRLLQTGDAAPVTVNAVNYKDLASGLGTLAFHVPSPAAAVEGMLDTVRFQAWVRNDQVLDLTWTDGLSAKGHFERCLKG